MIFSFHEFITESNSPISADDFINIINNVKDEGIEISTNLSYDYDDKYLYLTILLEFYNKPDISWFEECVDDAINRIGYYYPFKVVENNDIRVGDERIKFKLNYKVDEIDIRIGNLTDLLFDIGNVAPKGSSLKKLRSIKGGILTADAQLMKELRGVYIDVFGDDDDKDSLEIQIEYDGGESEYVAGESYLGDDSSIFFWDIVEEWDTHFGEYLRYRIVYPEWIESFNINKKDIFDD